MAQSISKSFTAVGLGGAIGIAVGRSFTYAVSGTFVGTVYLERSMDGGLTYQPILAAITAAASAILTVNPHPVRVPLYRFRCDLFTSGTIVTSIVTSVVAEQKVLTVGAKAGATSGFVVGAATDKGTMATCPQSKTASTLVLPIDGYKIGDVISGFSLLGNIVSAGGAVTVDASLRSLTAAVAGATDAAVDHGAMTQISVTAGTLMNALNAALSGINLLTVAGATYYLLITVTTAASTTIELEGVVVNLNEV